MKIVILDRDTLSPQTVLRTPSFRHEIQSWGRTAAEDVADRIADADIVVLNKVKLTAEAIATAHKLRLVAIAATRSTPSANALRSIRSNLSFAAGMTRL